MRADLKTMVVRAQFAEGNLGFDPAHGALLVGQAVRLRGDVNGDFWRVRQQLVQVLLLAGAQALQGPAVGVVAGVALLSVGHRQVL